MRLLSHILRPRLEATAHCDLPWGTWRVRGVREEYCQIRQDDHQTREHPCGCCRTSSARAWRPPPTATSRGVRGVSVGYVKSTVRSARTIIKRGSTHAAAVAHPPPAPGGHRPLRPPVGYVECPWGT